MRVEGISSVAEEQILVIEPEPVTFVAQAEGAVPGEPPIRGPVLQVHRQLVLGLVVHVGQGPDEDVAEPELPVEVSEAHLVVLPAAHKILFGFNVVPNLEDHPAAALRLQVAVDTPRALGQVRGVDQVDATLLRALVCLQVVTAQSHVERS